VDGPGLRLRSGRWRGLTLVFGSNRPPRRVPILEQDGSNFDFFEDGGTGRRGVAQENVIELGANLVSQECISLEF
jgi:hypothetical protein